MKIKFIGALLVAASTFIIAPAFASGYGPAPFYRPDVGAPASQRGQSAQTLAAERSSTGSDVRSAIGGVQVTSSESGASKSPSGLHSLYRGH